MTRKKLLFYFCYCGAPIIMLLFAAKTGALETFTKEFIALLSGNKDVAQAGSVALTIITILSLYMLIERFYHALKWIFRKRTERCLPVNNNPFKGALAFYFLGSLKEEFLFRWLPLGLIAKIPCLSGDIAFYILFLLSNGIFALLHIPNFDKSDWLVVYPVLSIFIAGLFFSFIFLKFGFLAAVATHFAVNMIIFAFGKFKYWADKKNSIYKWDPNTL